MNEHTGMNEPTRGSTDWKRSGSDGGGDAVDEALGELLELEAERQERNATAERTRRAEEERVRREEDERRKLAEDERVALAASLSSVEEDLDSTRRELHETKVELERSKVEVGCLQGALRVAQEAEAEARLGALETVGGKGSSRGRVPAWILVVNAFLIVAGIGAFVLGSSHQRQELARVDVEHRAQVERLQADFAQTQIAAARLLSKATSRAEREEVRAQAAESEVEAIRGTLAEATPTPTKGRSRPHAVRTKVKAPVVADRPARRVDRPRLPDDPIGEFELEL